MEFKKGGKVVLTPTGYPGEACTRMTGHYRKHMAGEQTAEAVTPEMYEEPEGDTNTRQQEKA